jgi:uncharacterized protein (TIGR01244 family)
VEAAKQLVQERWEEIPNMYLAFRILAVITAAGAMACSPSAPELEKMDVAGIKDFSRIEGSQGFAGALVGFGGATQPAAINWLRTEGFAAVINLRLATEDGASVEGSRAAAQAAGLTYIHLPFNSKSLDPNVVDEFLAAVGDEENQPVYIHCGSATRARYISSREKRDR